MLQRLRSRALRARAIAILVGGITICAGPAGGLASESPSVSELKESIASLEARLNALAPLEQRVRVLEAKLQQYEAASGPSAPKASVESGLILASLGNGKLEQDPMRVSPPTDDVAPERNSDWSGLYWGASLGLGASGSSSRYWNSRKSKSVSESSDTSSYTSDDYSDSGASGSSYVQDTVEYVSGHSAGTEWNNGALADLYLGASMHVTPRVVAGIQVEGGLSQMLFQSTIPKEQRKSRSTSRGMSSSRSSDGDTNQSKDRGTSSETQTYSFDEHNKLELDWMVSVIGRAGYLATPTTLVYGLAGWSYGHFDVEDLPFSVGYGQISEFGSHGVTVGGGLEQKLSSKWSLRAEYRYTNFGKESFSKRPTNTNSYSTASASKGTNSSTCCDGETSQSSSASSETSSHDYQDVYRSNGYFDNDMHVGRLGVTRYFTLGE